MHNNNIILFKSPDVIFLNINEIVRQYESNNFYIIDKNIEKYYNLDIPQDSKIVISSTEKNKSLIVVSKIVEFMLSKNFSRNTSIVGIGGGIVCDITGFVASVYKRGVKHILVPTTLLAMVDAAHGAKTGINHRGIKNTIGTFKSPEHIFIDTDILQTLKQKDILSGIGELIKISMTSNYELFNYLSNNYKNYNDNYHYIINEAIKTKNKIVEADFYDNNMRKVLNFGHTIGHIIELNNKIPHGIAISYGAVEELRFLQYLFNTNTQLIDNYIDILKRYRIFNKSKISLTIHKEQLSNDKKANNGIIDLINILEIGKSEVIKVSFNDLARYYGLH